jgi:hypothetical protein
MYHVAESSGPRHVEGIDVDLPEERGGSSDGRWNIDLMEVSGLTDVARICKPLDVHIHVRPPETFYEMGAGGIRTAVTYIIMGLCEELQAARRRHDYLVLSVGIPTP